MHAIGPNSVTSELGIVQRRAYDEGDLIDYYVI